MYAGWESVVSTVSCQLEHPHTTINDEKVDIGPERAKTKHTHFTHTHMAGIQNPRLRAESRIYPHTRVGGLLGVPVAGVGPAVGHAEHCNVRAFPD